MYSFSNGVQTPRSAISAIAAGVQLGILGWGHLRPAQPAAVQLLSRIPHHLQEVVVGFHDAVGIRDDDADDAGVEQTPHLGFGIPRFRVEPRVVDGEGHALCQFAGEGEILGNESSP